MISLEQLRLLESARAAHLTQGDCFIFSLRLVGSKARHDSLELDLRAGLFQAAEGEHAGEIRHSAAISPDFRGIAAPRPRSSG